MRILFQFFLAFIFSIPLFCQDKNKIHFGEITPADFILQKSPVIDSNTNAVIITDIGSTSFIGNQNHWFSYVYKRYVRIKIINDKAQDLSTIQIRLYGSKNRKDTLSDLKGATYNLENGKVIRNELHKSDVFEDKLSSFTTVTKFGLPSVKAGSIIEYSYTITSYRVHSIPPFYFQYFNYPCLYSEFKVVIPDVLRYLTVRYGLDSFYQSKTSMVKNNHYSMGDLAVTSNDMMRVWSMKDIPPFKTEKFINAPIDYLDKVEFFLSKTYNGEDVHDLTGSWDGMTSELLEADYFGAAIDKDHASNLLSTAERITSGDRSLPDAARHIYYYVRDNFTCVPDNEIYILHDLFNVNKMKKGSVAEINLLLIALLRQKGILADPVILSTSDYGTNPSQYPVLDKMNYVICQAKMGTETVYLDASRPYLGFGKLSIDCYNGHARVISTNGNSIYLYPNQVPEQKSTTVIIYKDQNGNLNGSYKSTTGYFGSERIRREIKNSDLNTYFEDLKSGLTGELVISKLMIDSLSDPEFPVTVHFDLKIPSLGDIFYFNPVIQNPYVKNPFEVEDRKFPVELPYPLDEIYVLNMEIPDGYVVDELPKSTKVAFNGDQGFFEYLIQKDSSRIQFRTHIVLKEYVFPAEDYDSLREFFAFIIKKFNEQIVLKKKS